MKTLEVIQYLIDEVYKENSYFEHYYKKMSEIKNKYGVLSTEHRNFYQSAKQPNEALIKQNLKKIRKLTIKLEKEIKEMGEF